MSSIPNLLKTILQLLSIVFILLPSLGSAKQSPLDQYYQTKLMRLNQLLMNDKSALKNDNTKLRSFVDKNVLPLWSSVTTLKALLGPKNWKNISKNKQVSLTNAFNQTLHRYVREGMKYYDDQKFSFVSTQLSKRGDRGYLKILIEPEMLPSINVTFKMVKLESEWRLYDIFVAGISYVKMKKLEIRRLYVEQGVDGVLSYLEAKNTSNKSSNSSKKS